MRRSDGGHARVAAPGSHLDHHLFPDCIGTCGAAEDAESQRDSDMGWTIALSCTSGYSTFVYYLWESIEMATLVRACQLSDLEEGEIFQADIEGLGKVALYLVGNEIFATDDTCSHGQASLSEDGFVDAFTVTCSWHDGAFDIRTGKPTALPCMVAIRTHEVVIVGAEVLIKAVP